MTLHKLKHDLSQQPCQQFCQGRLITTILTTGAICTHYVQEQVFGLNTFGACLVRTENLCGLTVWKHNLQWFAESLHHTKSGLSIVNGMDYWTEHLCAKSFLWPKATFACLRTIEALWHNLSLLAQWVWVNSKAKKVHRRLEKWPYL